MDENKSNTDTFDLNAGKLDGHIYTMPAYYLPKTAKSGMSQKTLLLIIGGVILVLIVIIFSVILLQSNQTNQQIATPTTPITETPIVDPIEEDEPDTIIEPEEQPTIEEPEVILPETILPPISVPTAQVSTDTDQDGLTDAEEALFLTSPAVPDTDQDSFLDGPELTNLYDPSTPGALIEISPQVKIVRNAPRGYQMLIPSSWTGALAIPSGDEFIIRPTDGTETFEIEMIENPERMTPVQWYQQQDPGADLSLFNSFENDAGWNGIRSQDGRVVIATFGSTGVGARAFVFVMHYEPGVDSVLRYSSIWSMILQSLSVLVEETPTSGSTTVAN